MKKAITVLAYFIGFILLLAISTLRMVDRTPPQDQGYYHAMTNRLDSLATSILIADPKPFDLGYAKVSITPDSTMALAGYGARKPKEFDGIMDSVFIRTIVIQTPGKKVAVISADLLIIHPAMTKALHEKLIPMGWKPQDVFLTATHSHSSIGQWAPGLVGGLFAGEYNARVAFVVADRMIQSLIMAEEKPTKASLAYSSTENPDLVLNRLVGDNGEEDPFQKNIHFQTENGAIIFSAFSAHATCLTKSSNRLSGDFPSYFHREFQHDTSTIFSVYAAGPVASMGPETPAKMDPFERTQYLGKEMAQRIKVPAQFQDSIALSSFRIPIELGGPQFKIAKNVALRPYLFDFAFGSEKAEICALLLGNTLMVGTPCDFSGELAVPLYKAAKKKGLNLIITSFNGGYIGYVTKDEWYDMGKYETRTMNWYGPGNGGYFSEIIKKIIAFYDQNN